MEVTLVGKLLIAALIAAITGVIAGLIDRRGNDARVGRGCGIMFPIAVVVFFGLQFVLPDVVVISVDDGQLSHDTKSVISYIKTPSGQSTHLSLCSKYIANFSDETLILYPEYYGPEDAASTVSKEKPVTIEPYTVKQIERMPDYYFRDAPSTIRSKSHSVVVKWVLEPLKYVIGRDDIELEQ